MTNPQSITKTENVKHLEHLLEASLNRYKFLNEKLPEFENKNKLLLLKNLRVIYAYYFNASKDFKVKVLTNFKKVYSHTKNRGLKNILFRNFPNLISKLYISFKKESIT